MTKISKKILIGAFAVLMALAIVVMPFLYYKKTGKVYAEQQAVVGGYYTGYQQTPVMICNTSGNSQSTAMYGGYLIYSYDIMPGTANSFIVEMIADYGPLRVVTNSGSSTYSVQQQILYKTNVGSTGTAGRYDTTLPNYNCPVTITSDTFDYYFGWCSSGLCVYLNLYHTLGANDSFFNGQVVSITIASSWGSQVHGWSTYWSNKFTNRTSSFSYFITTWTYTDTNGATFNIAMPTFDSFGATGHTYYNVESIGESAQYQIGWDNGYNNGKSLGYGQGYSAGQENGYSTGYNAGLIDGAESDYSFIGLIGATIDAPIKALTGLLNFEILGVNLSAFVYGLFSITLVIIIIKYIKGSK